MSGTEYCGLYDLRFLMKRGILINIPLYKTLEAILEIKKGTAEDVSKVTGRAKTIESRYLNRLNKIGIVAKIKEGRKVYYVEAVTAVKEALKIYGDNLMVEHLAHQISLPADVVRLIIELIRAGKA